MIDYGDARFTRMCLETLDRIDNHVATGRHPDEDAELEETPLAELERQGALELAGELSRAAAHVSRYQSFDSRDLQSLLKRAARYVRLTA